MVTTVTSKDLRNESDEELAEFMAGWRVDTGNYILADKEFQRRRSGTNEFRGWFALVLSALAFIVSVIALASKSAA